MEKLTCALAKQIDMVDFLASLGYEPSKIRNNDYWYKSPLRNEQTASFKVNRKGNVWFDHGIGKGGDLIDFGISYFRCTIPELLQKLSSGGAETFLFQPQAPPKLLGIVKEISAGEKKMENGNKIVVTDSRIISDSRLIAYLEKRNIPLAIARQYCREVAFLLYGKKQTAIGFKNDEGGYELRNEFFKGSSSPKAISFFDSGAKSLDVFEGFFDLMSFKAITQKATGPPANFLVLNSLAFFQKSWELMEQHKHVSLYLDRDDAGMKLTKEALERSPERFTDQSNLYRNQKDLNDWLKQPETLKAFKKHGRSI
ncbi:DNA primase [Flavobacterium sp. Sd200]|uniref:toprim domain-containing protein n=1 Tax=Flavobacterium sp. Sd200 TaxID=2692211 RepID=UPI00136D5C8D|nr:toprim domain-containing protein [Flavobacterium sp. Sd200]MXN93219.1 DNA primase [Flavobacterium sp. Sd200]